MKSSLIITTYNWESALDLCLSSVLKQTVLPTEVLIADDGSKEGTKILIEGYQKNFPVPLSHIWHEDNGFRASVIRNKAIAASSGDYLILLDGDMIIGKNFIKDHVEFSKPGYFVQGSRILLNKKISKDIVEKQLNLPGFFSKNIKNRKNTLSLKSLRSVFKGNSKNIEGIRSCNFAFWKNDFLSVNGFNEEIIGWGREDSELAIRLVNNGVLRQNLKFGASAYHLYHVENSRDRLTKNDQILQDTLKENKSYCSQGISNYINNATIFSTQN